MTLVKVSYVQKPMVSPCSYNCGYILHRYIGSSITKTMHYIYINHLKLTF